MNHWSTPLLGLRWSAGARGPDAFDCWGLVCWVYRTHLGIELPEYKDVPAKDKKAVIDAIRGATSEPDEWVRVKTPEPCCVVAMGQTYLSHVGLYLPEDGGLVLHAAEGSNVTAESLRAIRRQYRMVDFFKHGHSRPTT